MPDYPIPNGVTFLESPHISKRFRRGSFYTYSYNAASPTITYRTSSGSGTLTARLAEAGATAAGPNRYEFTFPDGVRGTYIESTVLLVGATNESATMENLIFEVDPIRAAR
jgi:hypothetical protein